jgi:nitrate reductase molybdenum cofactor assembly chaperone
MKGAPTPCDTTTGDVSKHETLSSALTFMAQLLAYPESSALVSRKATAKACAITLQNESEALAKVFQPFLDFVQTAPLSDQQEAYTRTFDFNPASSLEVGWHLYGEDYARGDFLVKCRDLLADYGIPESATELPDHLMYLLQVLAAMPPDVAQAFGSQYVARAVDKLVPGLASKRRDIPKDAEPESGLENQGSLPPEPAPRPLSPYRGLVLALQGYLHTHYPNTDTTPAAAPADIQQLYQASSGGLP